MTHQTTPQMAQRLIAANVPAAGLTAGVAAYFSQTSSVGL